MFFPPSLCAHTYARSVNCEKLTAPSSGTVDNDETTLGSVATYKCNEGFALDGEDTRTCIEGGWSGTAPTCGKAQFVC